MKIFIFYSTAGEGHRKVAEAVEQELLHLSVIHDVRSFDGLEKARPLFRASYSKTYFNMVKHAKWLWGLLYYGMDVPFVHGIIQPLRSLWNRYQSKVLRQFVCEERPDIIVTTHFYSAEVFARAKRRGEIQSKLITVITDVMPHSFWINPGTDKYWVMAEESKNMLIKRGVAESQIIVGGIPIKRQFLAEEDRLKLLQQFGLQQGRLTLLFTSGSFGIGPMNELIKEIEPFRDRIQAIIVCGNNQPLYQSLSKQTFAFPALVTGFVNNMHELMSVSDLIIAKTGGATTCEALAKNLPIVIVEPIPGQETRNATWLLNHRAALSLESPHHLSTIINNAVTQSQYLDHFKKEIKRIAKPNAANDLANFIIRQKDLKFDEAS